jgi:hypothetical protein
LTNSAIDAEKVGIEWDFIGLATKNMQKSFLLKTYCLVRDFGSKK